MKCEICGQGPMHGVSVFRANPKGQKGIWRCDAHLGDTKPDPEVRELVAILESGGKKQ
jgi:hypothetical protein